MGRSRSGSRSSSESSSDDDGRKHNGNRRLQRSDSRVRSAVHVVDSTVRSTIRSSTPPLPHDNVQRLESLVERLIEYEVSSRPSTSKVFVKPECIPEFKPGNPNLSCTKWIEKIEQLGRVNCWNEHTKIFHMQSRLSGLARKWYDNLSSYELSWNEWKTLLLKSFPEHQDAATSLRKLLNRRKLPSEGWEEYYFDKMDLINACEIKPKHAVSCLIDGINNPTIQVGARAERYETPDALYAEFLSSLNQEADSSYSPHPTSNPVPSRKRLHSDDRRKARSPFKKFRSNTKEQRCYNCKQPGHFSNNCPKPKLECSKCKRLGHLEKDCRRHFKIQIAEFKKQCHNDEYFFDCRINGMPSKAYVDTGCGAMLIREEQARELKLKINASSVTITGYGASKVSVLGETEFTIQLDNAEANVKAFVVPNAAQEVSVVVGQPFLSLPHVVMIVAEGKVRILSSSDDINEVLQSAPRKIPLWAKETVVVPPKTTAMIAVTSRNAVNGEVYVPGGLRSVPNREHYIGECTHKAKMALCPSRTSLNEKLR
ncbi:uncharacterized protein [Leptinotarsa decemlineata]|uniref:uncharacterized protein n=1 Tax=Leptinotarsa decemlineata TaxID=7539 RepID=UPI003D30C7A1